MLIGKNVELRPVTKPDLQNVYRWNNDEDITRLGSGSEFAYQINNPLEAIEAHYEQNLTQHNLLTHGYVFSVYEKESSQHIGKCDFRDINVITRSATIGLVIGEKDYWGKGYGMDIIMTLAKHLFYDLNMERIQLDTWSGNHQALRVYEKCGFQLEGRLRSNEFVNGEYYDTIMMGLLRSEFQPDLY
ncbi:GNAT family N-acetyltransferase [Pontibacillus yanchengensis]|uniref:Acetyltransferase n=1 Tax=Pontibacillus yanchengensis Y32 TaxID=1385514 RepID=A0A0A2TUU3_9BACI|nr:GNAT family protein [Pontibacillus yanchengensis]KGP73065.1 acetyltransferase [Pontibacillus yanchengensis Y32]